jgi:hypothetical protein
VDERFPDSGLSKVGAEVVAVARTSEADAEQLAEPHRKIRVLVGAVLAAGVACALLVISKLSFGDVQGEAIPLVQGVESAMNIAILVGLGVLALTRLESRWKQRRTLASLHKLRSLAHVIDMHQLTKDPSPGRPTLAPTTSSPKRDLTVPQLLRYLDYCSEMLSLIGKLAALYAQSLNDPVVVAAVNDIETLTTNLSRKIWQKIAIVGTTEADAAMPGRSDGSKGRRL